MQQHEVNDLAGNGFFEGKKLKGKIEETHISWVILSRRFAFKIKKPVKLSFLDFSTLRNRKKNCERELRLNRRFTDIYVAVVTIRAGANRLVIGGFGNGKIIDYGVQMKKMMPAKRMDKLLSAGRVKAEHVVSLAKIVGNAHLNCEIIHTPFNLTDALNLFNDIKQIDRFVEKYVGGESGSMFKEILTWNETFLKKRVDRFQARVDQGFKRDVHGDLHSGNIFLYAKPVLFDCIEFSDPFRQIDVLYEIAFLCMDLERFGMNDLAHEFLLIYNSIFPSIEVYEDFQIFNYFKCLRANVRAKVNALAALQAKNETDFVHHTEETKRYLALMASYVRADDSMLSFPGSR